MKDAGSMELLELFINNYDASDVIHELIIAFMGLLLLSGNRVKVRWKSH